MKITGRYYIKNFSKIYEEFEKKKSDIQVYIKNNLTYADSHVFGGSKKFFLNYVVPLASKTNDSNGIFIEHCVAKATLLGINDNLSFNHFSTYWKKWKSRVWVEVLVMAMFSVIWELLSPTSPPSRL